jgi:uncharacterized protein (DUF1697 family)
MMAKRIAILRGINVGGNKRMLMADLMLLLESLKFQNISTYIQSGNVIFDADEKSDTSELSTRIEQAIKEKFGFEVPVIIRTPEDLAALITGNPFLQTHTDTTQLHVTFLKESPAPENALKIDSYAFEPDGFSITDKDIYVFCAGKYHQSKLTNDFFEKKLKTKATTRNWNTVVKLYELSHVR